MTFEQFNNIESLLDNSSSPLLIQNGTVVDHAEIRKADVLVIDGKIEQVAENLKPVSEDTRVVDATGLYVMPGGIDVHTHFNIDAGITRSCDVLFYWHQSGCLWRHDDDHRSYGLWSKRV